MRINSTMSLRFKSCNSFLYNFNYLCFGGIMTLKLQSSSDLLCPDWPGKSAVDCIGKTKECLSIFRIKYYDLCFVMKIYGRFTDSLGVVISPKQK